MRDWLGMAPADFGLPPSWLHDALGEPPDPLGTIPLPLDGPTR